MEERVFFGAENERKDFLGDGTRESYRRGISSGGFQRRWTGEKRAGGIFDQRRELAGGETTSTLLGESLRFDFPALRFSIFTVTPCLLLIYGFFFIFAVGMWMLVLAIKGPVCLIFASLA